MKITTCVSGVIGLITITATSIQLNDVGIWWSIIPLMSGMFYIEELNK